MSCKTLTHGWVSLALLGGLAMVVIGAACNMRQGDDLCLNDSTEVSSSGARHVLSVALPFEPGPLAVVSGAGAQVSRSSRLWLGEDGLSLYALHGAGVWKVDLATLEHRRVGSVDRRAGLITGAEDDGTLLVTDPGQGSVWVLDEAGPDSPVRIPLGATPSAVALGPGNRLAYVANPGASRLDLLDTGVGVPSPVDREVLVGARTEGALLRLDGDGRLRARHDGLPGRLNDLTVIGDGRLAVASYSELVTTGDPGVTGDGVLVLHEGLCVVDLEEGGVEVFALQRSASREASLAWPTAVESLGDGQVAVALPGWGVLAVVDLAQGSPRRGEVVREIPVAGRPSHLARASLKGDLLYVLDDEAGTLSVVDPEGVVTSQLSLR